MKFLPDESAEFRIAAFLTNQGHDVKTIVQGYTPGLPDSEVLVIARYEQRILITNDRDFGELIFQQNLPHSGVIYFRLGLASTADEKIARLDRLLRTHADRLGRFLVVTPGRIRVRPIFER